MKSLGQRAPARGFLIPFHFYYGREAEEEKRGGRLSFLLQEQGITLLIRVSYRQHVGSILWKLQTQQQRMTPCFLYGGGRVGRVFHFQGNEYPESSVAISLKLTRIRRVWIDITRCL